MMIIAELMPLMFLQCSPDIVLICATLEHVKFFSLLFIFQILGAKSMAQWYLTTAWDKGKYVKRLSPTAHRSPESWWCLYQVGVANTLISHCPGTEVQFKCQWSLHWHLSHRCSHATSDTRAMLFEMFFLNIALCRIMNFWGAICGPVCR